LYEHYGSHTGSWTFSPENKHPTGSHIYQTSLKSLHVLPLTERLKDMLTKSINMPGDPKGKRKAIRPPAQAGQNQTADKTARGSS
jgi:hypothetical protein